MEKIVFLKTKSAKTTVTNSKGEQMSKLSVVLTTKELRMGESGVYATDADMVFDLIGDRADAFDQNVQQNDWLAIEYTTQAREYNGTYYGENRLTRYAKI